MTGRSPLSPAAADMAVLLAAVAQHRDRQAFAQLFTFYAPRVKTYLMRQGASDAIADELVQETLLTVWRKAGMFDVTKASVGTWVFTIARNLRIDALRKMRRPELDPNDPTLIPEPAAPPDDNIDAGQMELRLRDAMAHLPDDQAVALKLAFLEDKSHSAIAAALSLPLGTVKSRLRLALRRLRVLLED